MTFLPQKPYSVAHLTRAQPTCIYLDGHNLAWVEEFRYLGHILNSKLDDSADMQRAKCCLYYSTNMICAKLGFANTAVLVQLFRTFCSNLYGCELWNIASGSRAAQHCMWHTTHA